LKGTLTLPFHFERHIIDLPLFAFILKRRL
jgi:hypothetical protein